MSKKWIEEFNPAAAGVSDTIISYQYNNIMHDFRLLEITLDLSCITPLMRETIKSDKLF